MVVRHGSFKGAYKIRIIVRDQVCTTDSDILMAVARYYVTSNILDPSENAPLGFLTRERLSPSSKRMHVLLCTECSRSDPFISCRPATSKASKHDQKVCL